jgi:5'-deoxynucleotidase YfbR-like HD superfamily hydrolase
LSQCRFASAHEDCTQVRDNNKAQCGRTARLAAHAERTPARSARSLAIGYHGLARVARWNGQTDGEHAFSVAQHSLLVETVAGEIEPELGARFRLAALIHDAPEYVIGDLISPFKAALSLDYRAFEAKLLAAIHVRFGVPAEMPSDITKLIKRADKIAAYYEATTLAGFSRAEARRFFGQPRGLDPALVNTLSNLSPLPATEAELRFLQRFKQLYAKQEKDERSRRTQGP